MFMKNKFSILNINSTLNLTYKFELDNYLQ